MNGSIVGGRKIEVNNATARVQNKKSTTNNNLTNTLNSLNTNLTNKNIANLIAGLNPSSLPALMNLNRLASLNMLGLVAAQQQQQPIVKQTNLNANLNANLTNSSILSNPSLLNSDYANTIAQLSSNLTNNFTNTNLPNLQSSLTQNHLTSNSILNNNLVNLVAAAVSGNDQFNNFVQSQQQQQSPSIVQSTSTKFNTSPNLISLNPAAVMANNTNSNLQLSPSNLNSSANSYLNNLINNQLLAQLAQQPNLHYTSTNGAVTNSQNNHAVTNSSNLSLNLPSGKNSLSFDCLILNPFLFNSFPVLLNPYVRVSLLFCSNLEF